jgi:hypothetical protein
MRAEHQHGIPWIEEGLAEELLEDLGPGTDHDVLGLDADAIFALEVLGDRLAKRRQTG